MLSLEDKIAYTTNPEIYAAVHCVQNICRKSIRNYFQQDGDDSTLEDLIKFFCQYDKLRTQEIETLKLQLVDALKGQVKPMETGNVRS